MKSLLVSLILTVVSVPALAHSGHGHLSFQNGKIHAHLAWIQEPETGKEAKMQLEWHDGTTHAVIEPGTPFDVSLFMPDMGHGSAPTQIDKALDANGNAVLGTYQISNMYFMMEGSWEVRVTLEYSDGTEETQAWAVAVEGTGDICHGN